MNENEIKRDVCEKCGGAMVRGKIIGHHPVFWMPFVKRVSFKEMFSSLTKFKEIFFSNRGIKRTDAYACEQCGHISLWLADKENK